MFFGDSIASSECEVSDRCGCSSEANVSNGLCEIDQSSDLNHVVYANLSSNIESCKYVTSKIGFSERAKKSIIIIHANIRSLHKNFDSLLDFLEIFEIKPDLICLTETKLKDSPFVNLNIPNYHFSHSPSPSNAGGVAIYISSEFFLKNVNMQCLKTDQCEDMFVELCSRDGSNQFVCGVIYRHPKCNSKTFIKNLETKVMQLNQNKKTFYIAGDFNINTADTCSSPVINDYKNMLNSSGISCIITKPTRVTSSSSSLIDHILTNDIHNTIHPGVVQTDMLSDHYPIFCNITKNTNNSKNKRGSFKPIKYRDYTNFTAESYKDELNDALCNFIDRKLSCADASNLNELYNNFTCIITETINAHAPMRLASRKRQKLLKRPWRSKGIFISIKRKQKMYKTHFLSNNEKLIAIYKKYCAKLNKVKYAAKKTFFGKEFDKHKTNPRKTWQTIKSLLPKSNENIPAISKIVVDDNEIYDTTEIAEKFNTHFTNVGKNLAQTFTDQNEIAYSNFLCKRMPNSIFLEPVSPAEMFNVIHTLNSNKSPGLDGIPAYFIKMAADVIAVPLSILCNFSFSIGVFPECMKSAKVVPLFKSGSRCDLTNYRPISLLSCLSKVIEKLIHVRFINYLTRHSLLNPKQYGFRQGLSTNHALLDVVTTAYNNIDEKLYSSLVFVDYAKAFDTVCHKTLLDKLDHYGIRGPALHLVSSYLNCRTQNVSIDGLLSSPQNITYGVPQGSILGPLLFLIYVNDIHNIDKCSNNSIVQYADDTCLIVKASNLDELKIKTNTVLSRVEQWSSANKLTINQNKTKAIIISPKVNKCLNDISLTINNSPIQIVNSFKYLGVILDNKLSFKDHIINLGKKIARSVGIISKLRHYFPSKILLKLYFTLIHPHLMYGILVWGSTYKTYSKKIASLQNKALRLVTNNFNYNSGSASSMYKQLNILKLLDIYNYEVATFMYKFSINETPNTFTNYFAKTDTVHSTGTRQRSAGNFCIPRFRTSKLQRSIKYQGVKIWHSISLEIQKSASFKIFSKKYKNCLLSEYVSSIP